MIATKRQARELIEKGYDLNFVEKTQTRGGIKFDQRYISTGDGYVTVLALYEFAEDVNSRWLTDLMAIPNTVATFDISTANKEELLRSVNNSIGELDYRFSNETKTTDKTDALEDKYNLQDFAREISRKGEVVKTVQSRIFVYSDSLEELEKKVAEVRKDLGSINHKCIVPQFRMKEEWQSLFTNNKEQEAAIFSRKGLTVPSKNIGGGIPFHHKSLKDPRGFYLGTTSTGGAFIFDPFHFNKTRKSYNAFILGKMGFGKSTLLKQLQEGLQAKNCFIRGFDKSGEYEEMVLKSGGTYVDLGGGDMTVNPLQIYATSIDKSGNIDTNKSFQNHIAKCGNQLRFLEPDIDENRIREYNLLLQDFYIYKGLIPIEWKTAQTDEERNRLIGNIFDLPNESYPIYSDFLAYIEEKKFESATPERIRGMEVLKTIIQDMCVSYPQIFNSYTTMPNFDDQKIVYYNIDAISNLPEPIFHCQLFTALTTIWNSALKNGKRVRSLLRTKQISVRDSTDFMVFLDECHNIINPNNPYACEYVSKFAREMRKMRAGAYFATQSPELLLPSDSDSPVAKTIKTIFSLCTFKCFFNLDESVSMDIKRILGNTITDSELMLLSTLKEGEAICQTSSEDNYLVFFDPDKEQFERFDGGQ